MRTWQVADVMTRDVATVGTETPYRDVVDVLVRERAATARLMDREAVKRLPVLDDLGRLAGIVTRGDLLRVHLRTDAEIREDVVQEVLRRVLAVRDGLVTVQVSGGEVTMDGRLDRRSAVELAGRLAGQVAGVVAVHNAISYEVDDTTLMELDPVHATPVA
ncbi:CBS domain-containing protein [Micromonospora sp. WMMD980]|uniref:CBS domain-containing protein n=1 Tax=Micromonospora sp. WMMD980 TaxID=3016088 RepID=UPI002415A523|nr:CBS domain-containing protein [Micromonospora sp. WMMD980]MDG4800583.1 CBS domain-containing protein [Micromonospora sp. WMMD980]